MSLPHPAWRYVGSGAFTATFTSLLGALLTLGQSVTYNDGTTRTPGSGSAGTWTSVAANEALSVTPALSTLNHRLLIAGSAASVTGAVAASPDTTAINFLLVGVNKNSGAYADWKSATPYTSGQWFGFWRNYAIGSGAGTVYLYESTTSIYVYISLTGGTQSTSFLLGCPIDPQSTDTTNDAESDGYLYGVMTTGVTASTSPTWLSNVPTTDTIPFAHSVTASQCHFGVFVPGSAAITTCRRAWTLSSAGTTSGLKTRSGRFARHAVPVRATAAATNDVTLGELLGIKAFTSAQATQKQTEGANTIGYILTEDTATGGQEAYMLEYA